MIEERIAQIEERIRHSQSIPPEKRAELLTLLANLKSEMAQIARTHGDQAQAITGLTHATAEAATGEERDPKALEDSIESLSASVTEFEKSHPELVQIINRICVTLSNLGI